MALIFGQPQDLLPDPLLATFCQSSLYFRQAEFKDSIVTPQTVQIQELIRQIDETLRKSIPRFPWLQSGEADQQRQVLQQTRSYLVVLQQQAREAEDRPLTGSAATGQMSGHSVETAQQVLQAVLQEMNYLRTNMLQPLRSDIDALQQRRSALAQEVQQLEAQRQQSLPAANQQFVSEFLQSSMQQLQENLTGQVANMLASLSAQTPADQPLLGDGDALSPAQRLQQMQRLQAQSDQLMMRLDSAIRIIFESMHSNVNSYEASLEQGLNRMHTLGQQGEAMFSALVNRLAEHLGRETSTYLQSSLQVEASTSFGATPSVDTEIDQLLDELNGLDPANQASDFDQLDLSLESLDFSTDAVPADFYNDEITLFQHDLDSTDADITQFQEGSELSPLTSTTPTHAETEDLSSAMDLLNQLNGKTEWARDAGNESADVDGLEADNELYQSLFGDEAETEVGEVEVEPAAEFVDPIAEIVAEADTEPSIAEIAEISDLFFSGMGDPADQPEAEAAAAPEFSDAELSQSVEIFLLKVPDPEPTVIASTSLPEVAVSLEAPLPETIASLSDLISTPPIAAIQTDEQFEENTYEPARSEESLLMNLVRPPIMLDLDALPDDARQLLESDLSNLESSNSFFESQVAPIQVQEDMTLFDDSDTEHFSSLSQIFTDPSVLPASPEIDLDDFNFSTADSSTSQADLSLENFALPESISVSPPAIPMSQDHSSIPTAHEASLPEDADKFNAFSFDGLDDELFEQSPELKIDGRSLESEELLKKKIAP